MSGSPNDLATAPLATDADDVDALFGEVGGAPGRVPLSLLGTIDATARTTAAAAMAAATTLGAALDAAEAAIQGASTLAGQAKAAADTAGSTAGTANTVAAQAKTAADAAGLLAGAALPASRLGVASGAASLGADGKIPAGQVPTDTSRASAADLTTESNRAQGVEGSLLAKTARGAANGVAPLGADSKVPLVNLPAIPSTDIRARAAARAGRSVQVAYSGESILGGSATNNIAGAGAGLANIISWLSRGTIRHKINPLTGSNTSRPGTTAQTILSNFIADTAGADGVIAEIAGNSRYDAPGIAFCKSAMAQMIAEARARGQFFVALTLPHMVSGTTNIGYENDYNAWLVAYVASLADSMVIAVDIAALIWNPTTNAPANPKWYYSADASGTPAATEVHPTDLAHSTIIGPAVLAAMVAAGFCDAAGTYPNPIHAPVTADGSNKLAGDFTAAATAGVSAGWYISGAGATGSIIAGSTQTPPRRGNTQRITLAPGAANGAFSQTPNLDLKPLRGKRLACALRITAAGFQTAFQSSTIQSNPYPNNSWKVSVLPVTAEGGALTNAVPLSTSYVVVDGDLLLSGEFIVPMAADNIAFGVSWGPNNSTGAITLDLAEWALWVIEDGLLAATLPDLDAVRTVTASGTLLTTDKVVRVNSAGQTQQTLWTPSVLTRGKRITLKNLGSGVVIINGTLDGSIGNTLDNQYSAITLLDNGTTFDVLGRLGT